MKIASWLIVLLLFFCSTKLATGTFIRENGGKLADYGEALKIAEQEHVDRAQQEKQTRNKGHGDYGR